jgi:hypothetical protein
MGVAGGMSKHGTKFVEISGNSLSSSNVHISIIALLHHRKEEWLTPGAVLR